MSVLHLPQSFALSLPPPKCLPVPSSPFHTETTPQKSFHNQKCAISRRRRPKILIKSSYTSSGSPSPPADRSWPLPLSAEDSVTQARGACQRAIADGHGRLLVDFLLPLIGATELDDWPGGIQQQFKAASPLISSLLSNLVEGPKSSEPFAGCVKTVVDEGDAVAIWQNEQLAVMLFATGDTMKELTDLAANKSRPLILANPQWQSGQVISDFGFGARRKAAEELVSSFVNAYTLKRIRVQSKDVQLLRCYPGNWQVFVADENGSTDLVSVEPEMPSYKRLEEIVRKLQGLDTPTSWLDRLKQEFQFNKDSLKG